MKLVGLNRLQFFSFEEKKKRLVGIFADIGPTNFKRYDCIFLNEFDMLRTNVKILFVANKLFSRYKLFCVALKSCYTTSFESVETHSILKPKVSWADIFKFTYQRRPHQGQHQNKTHL